MAEEDGASRFLRSFASAVLERSLPAIRDWLVSRLGPGARIGAIRLEDGRVIVGDAQVPLGARLVLDVDEAILDARPEDMVAGLPPARLASLRGAIRAIERGETSFRAPVEVAGKGAASQAWVDGEVRVGGATWLPDRGVGAALPMYGTGRVVITGDGWRIVDASLTSGASQTKLDARGSLGEGGAAILEAVLSTRYARLGHALDVLSAFRGRDLPLPVPIPLDALVDGTVTRDPDGSTQVDLTLRTERSELAVKGRAIGGALAGAEVAGTVAPDEGLPAWVQRLADRAASGPIAVKATAEGKLDALDATIELEASAIASPWLREPRSGGAKLSVRGGRRWTVEAAIDGGGTGYAQLGIAPYGSIDGAAQLALLPAAWAVGPLTAGGDPVEIGVQIGGTRSTPELALELSGRALSLSRDAHVLATRRPRAEARVVIEQGKLHLRRAWGKARVGPGAAELAWDGREARLGLARVDAADALAGLGLVLAQDWIGPTDTARFVPPEGAQLWGELGLSGGRISGRAHVETARSRVSFVPLVYEAGSFEGTEALATVEPADAVALGLFRGSPLLPSGTGPLEVHAKWTGRGADAVLAATVTARRVGVAPRGGEELFALERASAELALSRDGLAVRALAATFLGGRLDARGGLYRDGDALVPRIEALTLVGAREGLRERLFGGRDDDALDDLALDVELAGEPASLCGRAVLSTARSRLEALLATRGAELADDCRVTGHVAPADLAPFLGPLALEGDPIGVLAIPTGRWARPTVALSLRGGDQHLAFGKVRAALAQLRVEATVGADGVDVSEASALLAGGRVEASAIASRAFGGAVARVRVRGVQLGDVERVRDELGGALHLDATFWRRGGAPGARVRARVEEPRYEGVRRFAALFSRYGLRLPALASTQPLTGSLALADGALAVEGVSADTGSFAVTGHASRSAIGLWKGEAALIAKQAWLETSHLFERPARWIGDVRVPVRVEGPDGRVQARADVLGALDAILARSRLGRGLASAIEALMRTLRFERPAVSDAHAPHAPSTLASIDALVDRVAAGGAESDAAIDALLERGLAPRELVERVTRRR